MTADQCCISVLADKKPSAKDNSVLLKKSASRPSPSCQHFQNAHPRRRDGANIYSSKDMQRIKVVVTHGMIRDPSSHCQIHPQQFRHMTQVFWLGTARGLTKIICDPLPSVRTERFWPDMMCLQIAQRVSMIFRARAREGGAPHKHIDGV